MKFLRSICFFFIFPILFMCVGFFAGAGTVFFFYPNPRADLDNTTWEKTDEVEPTEGRIHSVSALEGRLSVDAEYVLEEVDMRDDSVVETVSKLPDKYVGMNREQFIDAMTSYETSPPLMEKEKGFVGLEVLSFASDRVVIQMNYQPDQPHICFYLAVKDHEVVVYLEDKKTIYIHTGIWLENLPDKLQLDIIQMYPMEDEEELYDFLETYSS